MALAHRPPNTIHLGGEITKENEWKAGVALTPGMLYEKYDDGGKMKVRPHSSATEFTGANFVLEKLFHNKTVDDVYEINELVLGATFHPGSSVWALVPSGQNLAAGAPLQSNGDGMLKAATATTAAAGLAKFKALESTGGVVNVPTRLHVQIV